MGARGPAPRPTAMNEARGNPGKRRLNEGEPLPPTGDVAPPSWLSPAGREVWAQMAPTMVKMRVLTVADAWTFARYCEAYARYLELRQFLAGKGHASTVYPVKNADGTTRCLLEIPQAAEYRRYHEILIKMEQEFGLTPSSRSRINVEMMGGVPVATDDGDDWASIKRLALAGGPAKPRRARGQNASA